MFVSFILLGGFCGAVRLTSVMRRLPYVCRVTYFRCCRRPCRGLASTGRIRCGIVPSRAVFRRHWIPDWWSHARGGSGVELDRVHLRQVVRAPRETENRSIAVMNNGYAITWHSSIAQLHKMCEEEGVGFVDLWGYFVGKEDMYVRDSLRLSGKGATVFSETLLRSMDSGTGCNYLSCVT